MRKAIVLAMALVVALAMTSIGPAGAAPAEKETYEVLECMVAPGEPERSWFSGKNDRIWHFRGAENHMEEYMWVPHEDPEPEDLGDWVPVGSNHTVVNWNARWEMIPDFGPVPTKGSFWGKFELNTDFGHFKGRWAWGNWPAGKGRAVGKGMGDDAGKRIKVKLMTENPGWGDVEDDSFPQNCIDTDYALMKVINPRS